MRRIEQDAAQIDLPSEVLMEKAGLAVAKEVRAWLGSVEQTNILILVGPGNNGGDGLVAARYLHDWGANVQVYSPKPRSDADPHYQMVLHRGIASASADQGIVLEGMLATSDVIVDSLFGTGKSRPLEGVFKEILEKVRDSISIRPKTKLIAIDLPSGLNSDTGEVDASCVRSDLTITLANPKMGLFRFPGAAMIGELIIADIGIPSRLSDDILVELITAEMVARELPARPLDANKGTFGRVLVVAGSLHYIGAAYLACQGAMRVGAGLVTLATACSLQPILASKLIETTYAPLSEEEKGVIGPQATEEIQELLPNYDVLLVGCGLGQHPGTQKFIEALISSIPDRMPIVLDADALNMLAKNPRWWQELSAPAILTPHPGEFSRLKGISVGEVQRARFENAQQASSEWQKVVVLKGAHTVVADSDGRTRISGAANPCLASAGTGDVLSGAVAGMCAQGLTPFLAASCATYVHAKAGELARQSMGESGMIASDLLPVLPRAIKGIRENYATCN